MTPLSDALTAAQRRALQALEKAYVAGQLDDASAPNPIEGAKTEVVAGLLACGITDAVDIDYLLACLDVLREWGAPVPAETNGAKADPAGEKMSDKQRGFIEQLCREKEQPLPEDLELLSKANASEAINDLQAGTYDPAKWRIPF